MYRVNQLSLKRLDTPFIQSASKRVPVRLVQDLLPADGYAWSSELQIVPDSLTVFGLPSQVDTLMYALLDSPKSKMFNTSFDQKLALTTELQSNFKWSQTKVYVTQNISRYTQVELRLPVEVIDSDEKVDVSLIPAFVLVNLSVPIERVRQIEPSQFVLVCRLSSDTIAEYLEVNFEEVYLGCSQLKDIDNFLFKFGFVRVGLRKTNKGWGDAIYSKNDIFIAKFYYLFLPLIRVIKFPITISRFFIRKFIKR